MSKSGFLVAFKYRNAINIGSIRFFPNDIEGASAAVVYAKSLKSVGTPFIWEVSDGAEPRLLTDLMKFAELR
jgi:hypothetical protein